MVLLSLIIKNVTSKPNRNAQNEGTITHFNNEKMASRLLALGVAPGSGIERIRKAPFNGAWYVKVNGSTFALREEEFESIGIESRQPD